VSPKKSQAWTHTFPVLLKRKSRKPNGVVIVAKALAAHLAKSAVDRAKYSRAEIQMVTRNLVAATGVLVPKPHAVRPVVARASSNCKDTGAELLGDHHGRFQSI
jgi:hypothetical protein